MITIVRDIGAQPSAIFGGVTYDGTHQACLWWPNGPSLRPRLESNWCTLDVVFSTGAYSLDIVEIGHAAMASLNIAVFGQALRVPSGKSAGWGLRVISGAWHGGDAPKGTGTSSQVADAA